MYLKIKSKLAEIKYTLYGLVVLSLLMGSCASANRALYHGAKIPLYVSGDYKYYINGVEQQLFDDVSSATVNTENHYDYSVTTTTTTYSTALRLSANDKYVTVERRDNVGNKTYFLVRRTPLYLYFWFDQYLTFDVGTIVDIADGFIYDWEIVATTNFKK